MRIKWNRHLDGGASRRPEDEETAGTQEADEKKRGSSSSVSIFKIFRRSKKSRRRGEDEFKTDGNNGTVTSLVESEANDDDCASVSSVTTCASQPVTEGFQRDRASSLFSSFRLSLPGSKRKKRRIAPTPSESLLNGQQSETQIDRYSTPDLRKQSDKFDGSSNTQVCLSTSSPSIRNPKGSSSASAQSLASPNQNSESLDKLKWSNTKSIIGGPSSTKLSKSVSFSDCKDGLTDSSHSTCDNKAPRAVNSTAMVEEDSGALESESPTCLSDNPRMSRESRFTAVDSLSSTAVASGPQNRTEAVGMTKTETVSNQSSDIIKESAFAKIGNLLSDIATEIQSYEKSNDRNGITPADACPEDIDALSSLNSDSVNHPAVLKSETNSVPVGNKKDKKYEIRVDLKKYPSVQCVETDAPVCERQTNSKICNSSEKNDEVSLEQNGDIDKHSSTDKSSDSNLSLSNKLEVLSSELCVLTAAGSLSNINSCDAIENYPNVVEVREDVNRRKKFKHENLSVDEFSAIPNSNHVVCHMRIYENETVIQKLDSCKVNDTATTACETPSSSECLHSDHGLKNGENCQYKTTDNSVSSSVSKSSFDSYNDNSVSNNKLLPSSVSNSCSKHITDSDQKVPDDSDLRVSRNRSPPNDQQVPEFELSLLEFEEVCSRYMSGNNPESPNCDSTIPLYNNSPKRKSVLDRNFSLVNPNSPENGFNSEICFVNNLKNGEVSPARGDFDTKIAHYQNLQNSCQNITEKYSLPSPPKQWINCQKQIETESNRESQIAGVQCTKVRGKNLCQEPYPEDLPTTVMLGDSDLGGIDTPRLSSSLDDALENKSGRYHSSNTTDDRTLSEEMVSNVSFTISSLSRTLDYSLMPESPDKTSIFLDSQIRDGFRVPRAICDPLVYDTEVRKSFESLGPESYLNGHNFCDIRNVGFREIISDISHDYIQTGKSLIEISNPYEDSFMIPEDLTSRNLVGGSNTSLANGHDNYETADLSRNLILVEKGTVDENDVDIHSGDEKSFSSASGISEEVKEPVSNGKKHSTDTRTQLKNSKNNNKHSMIPCRTKVGSNNENKKIETKSKTKKSNSLPRIITKNESHLPVKNNHSSHRVFTNSCKDSIAEQQHKNKRKDSNPSNKANGAVISSDDSIHCEILANKLNFHSQRETNVNSSCCVAEESKASLRSSSLVDSVNFNLIGAVENGNLNDSAAQKNELEDSNSVLSITSISSIQDFEIQEPIINGVETPCGGNASAIDENYDGMIIDALCPECLHLDVQDGVDIPLDNSKYQFCSNHSDYAQRSRRSSVSAVGIRKTSFTSSKESLSSQVTNSSNIGKSRIPRKQAGTTRGGGTSKGTGPVRPPMWLSKAELTQEIQRLGTLCEARTKELNRLKMETKHVSVGFDAFAALFKYMVEDLNGLSVPALTQDLQKTLKQLELTKQDLAYYEREVEEMKSHHCQELNDLSNKLFEVYQSEVAELNSKHQEEINHVKSDHQQQIEHLTSNFDSTSEEEKAHYEKMVASLEQEIVNQRAELQEFQEREIRDLEEKHAEGSKVLQEHIEQLQKKCAELKQHAMSMEDAMRKDTDSKLQWVTTAKCDLEKEVESLKTVLEMKNKELHTLRVQNLEMEKQLEELPLAREKIKMLQARAEDLEALMVEKTKLERKLSTENQQMRDTYERESKVNRRLSMENEELQWRLRQAENSLISGSFTEVPEFPEAEENAATLSPTSPTKSQSMSRSVFFTFVDKDESVPHSPRTQYKKITPNFSANYKTSPAKTSKSPPAPSPRRGKSHSEPPQPFTTTSTPRKVAKQPLSKAKGPQKRQRSGSDSTRPNEPADVNFSSMMAESMASSVSSESSVFEHRERLLEEHKEHIIHSLEILREQRSTEGSVDEGPAVVMEKKWRSDDIKITGELSNLEMDADMSRSAEFSDPKTYYHMTFPVLKESGMITDCDMENSSSSNSPVKEVMPTNAMHSRSVSNIPSAVEASETLTHVLSLSVQEVSSSTTVNRLESKRHSCTEASVNNVQKKDCEKTENRYRTI